MTLLLSKSDPYLKHRLDAVVVESDHIHGDAPTYTVCCMRVCWWVQWLGDVGQDRGWLHHIVVPAGYRQHVLTLVDEQLWSVHLGTKKTHDHTLKHFFSQA